jgi:glutathione S-transferase
MMKLIASLTSPFARKVRIVLAEKNIPYQLVVDIPWDAQTRVPEFNPLGKVPVWW